MKNIIIIILYNFFLIGCASKISSQILEIKNEQLNYVLGNLRTESVKSFLLDNTYIKTCIYTNESGSANTPETDEVTDNIIFTVCESGEKFNCKSYELKNLLNPKIDSIINNNECYVAFITYTKLQYDSYQKTQIKINIPLIELR